MRWTDDQTDIGETGIGQTADDVVEKGPRNRDHAFDAGIGNALLFGIEIDRGIRTPHASARARGEDYSLAAQFWSAPRQRRGMMRNKTAPLITNRASQTIPCAVRP